ncbi:hypothetical protein B0H34DRAFT_698026 [Crassisporium funariophilum]|nr:hypothetical protein B0H34DRAFT_698026 [Crassisporium funariophilum]
MRKERYFCAPVIPLERHLLNLSSTGILIWAFVHRVYARFIPLFADSGIPDWAVVQVGYVCSINNPIKISRGSGTRRYSIVC